MRKKEVEMSPPGISSYRGLVSVKRTATDQ